jgi:hypothetical protein
MFRRRHRCSPGDTAADVTILAVRFDERERPAALAAMAAFDGEWAALRRLVAEAVILQDAAEDLLLSLRDRPDPSEVARPCSRLKIRFVELREALPSCDDPDMNRYTTALRQIFDHHVLLLKTSMGLLAGAARCERLDERLDDIDGLGFPGRRLEHIRAELLRRTPAAVSAP